MKINKVLISKIKEMDGSLLGFGIKDDGVLEAIEKNNKITICNLLDENSKGKGSGKKNKKVRINNIRKVFKKKKTNHLICNYELLKKDLKTFISDSIYITKDNICFYTKEKDELIKKYSRYNTEIEEIKCSDGYVLMINVKKAKNNKIKELYYQIIDFFIKVGDLITEMLLS